MQDVNTNKIDGNKYLEPHVGFDWYVTGYCISHFEVEWNLSARNATDENIELLVKGFISSSTAKGKIQTLHLHFSTNLLYISQLKDIYKLRSLCLCGLDVDNGDEVVLCRLIQHQSRLRKVEYYGVVHSFFRKTGTGLFIPMLLGLSSMEELTISFDVKIQTQLLPHSNTNLKQLTIHQELIQPLATLLPNISSLTYLEVVGLVTGSDIPVLIITVQSLHMLEVLHLGFRHMHSDSRIHDLSELVVTAGISRLKELRLDPYYYDKLPQHIQVHYNHLLKNTIELDYQTMTNLLCDP